MSTTMSRPPRAPSERTFWFGALGFALVIATLIGVIILRGSTVSLAVTVTPAPGTTVPGVTRIVLTFPVAMRTETVEPRLAVVPLTPGRWVWSENGLRSDRVAQFVPARPLISGVTYRATLMPGAQALNGRTVTRPVAWEFNVRAASVLFLRHAASGTSGALNIWVANADGTDARQITDEANGVREYSAASDGSRIAYTTPEDQQNSSLWVINRDGTHRVRLSVPNDPSFYANPAWSPAGDVIVYALRSVLPSQGSSSRSLVGGASQQVTFDVATLWAVTPDGQALGRVYGQAGRVGYDPIWSPDGTHLAFRGSMRAQGDDRVIPDGEQPMWIA